MRAEQIVYSKELNVIGTFDALAEVDGKITLIDYKTSKSLHPDYILQLIGYCILWHEEKIASEDKSKPDIEQMMIIHLDKENGEMKEPIMYDIKSETSDDLADGFLGAVNFKKAERIARKLLLSK